MKTPKDFRGVDLVPGTLVAYNLSGAMAIGKILSFTQFKGNAGVGILGWGDWFKFIVEVVEAESFSPGHKSKVNHQRNLMALTKDIVS